MKVAIIASSNGGAFIKIFDILIKQGYSSKNFIVITDRECGIERFCRDNNIECKRINEKNNRLFSLKANNFIAKFGKVSFILLFYNRLITKELFESYPCYNIHPSLLPAFKGFNAIQKAVEYNVKFFGTTLHIVNEGIDNGKIIAQTCMPKSISISENTINKCVYIQKIYLGLLIFDLHENNYIQFPQNDYSDYFIKMELKSNDRCNPMLINENYKKEIMIYQQELGVDVVC